MKSYARSFNEWNTRSADSELTADRLYALVLSLTDDEDKAGAAYANRVLEEEKSKWQLSQGKTS